MRYLFHLVVYLNVYAILALSLNIVVGYCGLLTLAHAGYFAIGCYAYALASLKAGWGFLPSLALAVMVSSFLSLAVSLPAWRFKGNFFLLISLAVQVLIFGLIYNWADANSEIGTWTNLTNGPLGIAGIPKPATLGIRFDTPGGQAVLSTLLACACAAICHALLSSPWGRLLKAMRDDELAARGLGKNVRLAKAQAFAIACGMAAAAGTLYASYTSYIDPSVASLDESVLMLCMVLVGGVGNFRGPLVGAVVLLAIPELLRLAQLPAGIAANLRLLAYGVLMIVIVHVRPQGLAGDYRFD